MSISLRTCIVTRMRHNKSDLVRIVLHYDRVQVESKETLPGRGVYLTPKLEIFEEAIKKNKISVNLKMKRKLSKDEVENLRKEFVQVLNSKFLRNELH